MEIVDSIADRGEDAGEADEFKIEDIETIKVQNAKLKEKMVLKLAKAKMLVQKNQIFPTKKYKDYLKEKEREESNEENKLGLGYSEESEEDEEMGNDPPRTSGD